MKDIINTENILIQEVEDSDWDKWLKEEFKESHPNTLVKETFPENIMNIVRSDGCKSRDFCFDIWYNHSREKWYMSHPGYIRNRVSVEGDTFLECARKYLMRIREENSKLLYGEIEQQVNDHLPIDVYCEISENSISIFQVEGGRDELKCVARYDKPKTLKGIIKRCEEILKENDFKGERDG